MITAQKRLLSGTPDEVRAIIEHLDCDQEHLEYLASTWLRELAVELAARDGLIVSAVSYDDMAGYELEATLVSASHHDPIMIGRSRTGDHCQVTPERWLAVIGDVRDVSGFGGSGEIRHCVRGGRYARLTVLCLRNGRRLAARWRGPWDEWAALVLRGCRVLRVRVGMGRAGISRAAGAVLVVVTAAGGAASCTGAAAGHGPPAHVRVTAHTRVPAPATSVLAGAPDVVAGGVASRLFASAPVVVVASPGSPAGLAAATRSALRAHAPLLLTAGPAARAAARTVSGRPAGPAAVVSAMLRAQIRALDPRAVLAAGMARDVLAAQLPGIRVVTDPAMLPATTTPPPLGHLALLVRSGSSDAGTLAAVTTARVAGARVIAVRGADPRADPAAIAALSAARPRQVLAIGAGFGPAGWHRG